MKRKIMITTALVFGFLFVTFAQNKRKEVKLKAKKVAFVTKFLELTPEESKAFWPVYKKQKEEKIEKIQPLKRANKESKKKLEEMSDADVRQIMETTLRIRQIELDIDKKYMKRFLEILPPKKVAKLYHIERRFKKVQHKKGQAKKGNNKK